MEVQIDAVDVDQLPRERGLQYDFIAKIVGSLYLDYHQGLNVAEERYSAMVQELQRVIDELKQKNTFLEEQLRKINEQRILGKSNNGGQNEG